MATLRSAAPVLNAMRATAFSAAALVPEEATKKVCV